MTIQAPRMSLIIPLRSRLQFTTNILPTAILRASRPDHDIVVVRDQCSIGYDYERRGGVEDIARATHDDRLDRGLVGYWFDTHQDLLKNVRVYESYGDRRCWTGGLRSSAALNVGVERAETEWIIGIGDEDLCFEQDWDVALWRGLIGHDPMKTVSTLTMVMPNVWPVPWSSAGAEKTPAWIHASRSRACHQLSLPVSEAQGQIQNVRISERTWREYADLARLPGIHQEACGERRMCHWVPMLMHRDLLKKVGMWPIGDDCAFSYDIELDNRLAREGVQKRMPQDALVLHAKHHLWMSNAIDAEWCAPSLLKLLQGVEVI